MRLPWPFGRRTPSDGPPSATPEDAPGGATPVNASPTPGPGLAPATGAWASLPPIQRTMSDPPLVAPAAPFLADVAGHRALPPIVQPLGHEVSRTAPPGLVVAHVSTVPSLTSGVPMPTRSAQRRTADASPTEESPGWSAEPAIGAATAVSAPSSVAATAPIRSLATVSPATRVTPAARPLTRSPEPVAVAQRSTGRPGASTLSSSAPLGRPPATTLAVPTLTSTPGARSTPPLRGTPVPPVRGAPAARTLSRWAEAPSTSPAPAAGLGAPLHLAPDAASRPGVRETPSSAEAAVPPSAPSAQLPEAPGAAPPRRAGLGAPLSISPDASVAQRLPLGSPTRRPDAPSSPDTALAATPVATPTPGGQVATTTPAPGRSLPVLSVARRRADAPDAPAGATLPAAVLPTRSGSAGDTTVAHHVASAAVSSSAATAPTLATLGFRPLRSGVTAQRDAIAAAQATATAPVPARRAPGDDLPATVRSITPAQAGGPEEAPVSLQRLGDVPVDSPAAAFPALPRAIIFPSRDASSGGWPAGDTSAGPGGLADRSWPSGVQRQPEAGSIPGSWSRAPTPSAVAGHPTAGPGAQQHRPLGLNRSRAAAAAAATPTPAEAPVAARIVAGPASPATQPVVQTSPASAGGSPVGGFMATPVVQRVDGAAPAAPSEEGRSESELDELARSLFGRFRTHLRAEVIHEREARGLSFDAF